MQRINFTRKKIKRFKYHFIKKTNNKLKFPIIKDDFDSFFHFQRESLKIILKLSKCYKFLFLNQQYLRKFYGNAKNKELKKITKKIFYTSFNQNYMLNFFFYIENRFCTILYQSFIVSKIKFLKQLILHKKLFINNSIQLSEKQTINFFDFIHIPFSLFHNTTLLNKNIKRFILLKFKILKYFQKACCNFYIKKFCFSFLNIKNKFFFLYLRDFSRIRFNFFYVEFNLKKFLSRKKFYYKNKKFDIIKNEIQKNRHLSPHHRLKIRFFVIFFIVLFWYTYNINYTNFKNNNNQFISTKLYNYIIQYYIFFRSPQIWYRKDNKFLFFDREISKFYIYNIKHLNKFIWCLKRKKKYIFNVMFLFNYIKWC